MSEREPIRALHVDNDDDDADIFMRYVRRLRDYDVTIERATTHDEAVAALKTFEFDMVFLDLNLGGGLAGLNVLKSVPGRAAGTPFIVVTGSGDEMMAVEAMKNGAYDYIVKDVLSSELIERTIRSVKHRLALEQERDRAVARLAELSVTDELTGIPNRRRLMEKLDEEIRRSERTGRPFSLLMLDLDHFKQVNDRHGHQTGDEVLRQCAAILKKSVRSIDTVARYGGEEFCIILPETSLDAARAVAEKVREAIKALPEPVPTVSIGVSLWQPKQPHGELLARADKALYHAKETGRDRVEVFQEE